MLLPVLAGLVGWYALLRTPVSAVRGVEAPPGLAETLKADVAYLASSPRNVDVLDHFVASAAHIEKELRAAGYRVTSHAYTVDGAFKVRNIEAEKIGRTRQSEIVVIGAHYDSIDDSPGADDNASGVAGLIAIARAMAGDATERTVRFVAFANEEPPDFQTTQMGSYVYAKRAHERGENIIGMISIESVGYFSDAPESQSYPAALRSFYPSTGNFVAFTSNIRSRALLHRCVKSFARHSSLGVESAALPEMIREVGWSDQWSFWQFGWPAVMVTDTAPFRNPNYHTANDRPETLDYMRMARVVSGLTGVVRELANGTI
jgi:Zn-dependent M28 family amino/carboxypeptidase